VRVTVSALQRTEMAEEARRNSIRLVDCSKLGWRVVQYYLADLTVDDADEEERMRKIA
jgi:hypothetical protein